MTTEYLNKQRRFEVQQIATEIERCEKTIEREKEKLALENIDRDRVRATICKKKKQIEDLHAKSTAVERGEHDRRFLSESKANQLHAVENSRSSFHMKKRRNHFKTFQRRKPQKARKECTDLDWFLYQGASKKAMRNLRARPNNFGIRENGIVYFGELPEDGGAIKIVEWEKKGHYLEVFDSGTYSKYYYNPETRRNELCETKQMIDWKR